MIEDEELRSLYKIASEEHLQNLEAGLLHLEKDPHDLQRLQEVLREAHTLKGDSRMLGVNDVEALTHQIEHILGQLKENDTVLQNGMSDRLYQGLDAIRQLVKEAITGEPSGVNTLAVLALLMGANPPSPAEPPPEVEETALETVSEEASPPEPLPQVEETPTEVISGELIPPSPVAVAEKPRVAPVPQKPLLPPQNSSYRIDSVRVETRNLDALMTQAGELTVTKIRMAHHIAELEELTNLWEEWSRQTHNSRFALETNLTQLQNLQQRHEERLQTLGELVNRLRARASEDVARLEAIASELESGIRTLRLLPLSNLFNLFPRLVRDLAKQQGKKVNLVLEGGETKADKRILEEMKDPLMHMLRNAIDHGIESPAEREALNKPQAATIRLKGYQIGNSIIIEIQDDGRGLNLEQIQQTALKRGNWRKEELDAMTPQQIQALIFAPGFSTRQAVTEVSGRGVGLDVVRTNVERLKGNIQVESTPNQGCHFRIQLSTTLATVSVLIVAVEGRPYAIPVEFVQTSLLVPERDIFSIEGRETIALEDRAISVVRLVELLNLPPGESQSIYQNGQLPCIILQVGSERLGVIVDDLIDEQDVILKPQSKLLKRVLNVSGATILGTGEVCIVLNPQDMIRSVQKKTAIAIAASQVAEAAAIAPAVILLAEDSIATRTQEKRILEAAGYQVVAAVDGLDAYHKLRSGRFDAVVSDVQMPNLDGFALTARIRQHPEYNELPVVLVTSLASDDDKRRGAEAGASAYLTKGTFNQDALIETLRRLIV
ncbi:hybrid sensor histidine kinase/response regulator [Desertifilum sp. FACHB-1129]|uniref:histidine kinase n=1 Tax=Desertifilum tharense IPPAS B-1220 TaxID=1781255 RepID=A0A1E5QRC7_9CYAN|nr:MULTISPECIES: hybrid sensor histidine kinase/response regulator [Desertifilum]MDA0208665.1 hybrid sensor histidine kinase/response regulator [Cyanobacteria bacterium FC1]MBD2310865.1 hybrid sensor histidine kinase/response regulator [Desertifilum sp. FACHB-1129]MBD2321270.1 hybrid sensor histidine kinase/response regulator [Desertifilum sp. FACHB-866]MBD2331423.1 hybrid sensor histidine kinase/response regulator [Desertifilum sp. FACHB-868]OEJ77208.1 hybrid sensor histidine kinase/response 